jgi:hypothetical protein
VSSEQSASARIVAARSELWRPQWRRGWEVRPGNLAYTLPWTLTAVDASGEVFGFGVKAGWPEMGETLLRSLHELLVATGCAEDPTRS